MVQPSLQQDMAVLIRMKEGILAMRISFLCAGLIACVAASASDAQVRIKDITDLDGARANQLLGYGIVVGLDGTGSRSAATQQAAVDLLRKLNVGQTIYAQNPSDNVLRTTSAAQVIVTAEIGPYARKGGSRLDVTVSVVDDAKSLQGGMLLRTPLYGVDGEVYAVAQGPLSVGGFAAKGAAASVQKNQLNVGRVPNGAMVE